MPTRCCVPGCSSTGGHRFPVDVAMELKWRVAVRRQGVNKSLWKPGKGAVVCHQHFKPSDYKSTLLGRHI